MNIINDFESLDLSLTGSVALAGACTIYYGCKKWSRASNWKGYLSAWGLIAFGTSCVIVSVASYVLAKRDIQNRKDIRSSPEENLQNCRNQLKNRVSIDIGKIHRTFNDLQEGVHYNVIAQIYDNQLFCGALLTDLGYQEMLRKVKDEL